MKKISKLIVILLFLLAYLGSPKILYAKESEKVFSSREVENAANINDLSVEYIEKYNDKDIYTATLKDMNVSKGIITEEQKEGCLIRKVIKKGYLDKERKLEIVMIEVSVIPSINMRSETMAHYQSESTSLGYLKTTQYIDYYLRLNGGLNTASANIVDVYGTYSGAGVVDISNNHSTGFTHDNWATSAFQITISGWVSDHIVARSHMDVYGIWKTEWTS